MENKKKSVVHQGVNHEDEKNHPFIKEQMDKYLKNVQMLKQEDSNYLLM
jgi:hypothetical protein